MSLRRSRPKLSRDSPRRPAFPAIWRDRLCWFLGGSGLAGVLVTAHHLLLALPLSPVSYGLPVLAGGAAGLLIHRREIGRMQSQRRLEASVARLKTLYQRTPAMTHSIDAAGRLVFVSDLWLETLGYRREEVIGRPLTDFLSEASRRSAEKHFMPEFFRTGRLRDVSYQMVTKSGDLIEVLLSATAERDDQGRFVRSLAVVSDVSERRRAEEKVEKLAYFDSLTGLPNRTLLQDRLHLALAQARREHWQLGVLFLDLDRFKFINDTLGHATGDQLLKSVARRLLGCVRESDTVARLGGDEFVIILPSVHASQDLSVFAQKILETLSRPLRLGKKQLFTTASIGIAVYPHDAEEADLLLRHADIAMYAAKEKGKNSFQFFSRAMNARLVEDLGLETRLRRALKGEQFFLAYQPQMDLASGRITGLEALLRWRHPEAGIIPTAAFIRVAEETGLIVPIGEWVLRTALDQARRWEEAGVAPVRMAVNISGRQFDQPDFIDMVDTILKETGFDPARLELELTESVVMANVADTILTLTDLKVRGIHLAIDDFGTGYSSLSYLKHFPFDRIKIAQEFVSNLADNPEDAAIVEAITVMAESLGLQVIAEGVETKAQLDFLRACHCPEMQGFLFRRPLPAPEIYQLLRHEGQSAPSFMTH